jgi:hypothetical protein
MRTTAVRIAALAAVAGAFAWLLATAAPALAGTYTVNACQANRFGFSTKAFVDFSTLGNMPTAGVYMRRACAPTDTGPACCAPPGQARPSGRLRAGRAAGHQLPRARVVRGGRAARLPLRAPVVRGGPRLVATEENPQLARQPQLPQGRARHHAAPGRPGSDYRVADLHRRGVLAAGGEVGRVAEAAVAPAAQHRDIAEP